MGDRSPPCIWEFAQIWAGFKIFWANLGKAYDAFGQRVATHNITFRELHPLVLLELVFFSIIKCHCLLYSFVMDFFRQWFYFLGKKGQPPKEQVTWHAYDHKLWKHICQKCWHGNHDDSFGELSNGTTPNSLKQKEVEIKWFGSLALVFVPYVSIFLHYKC